MKITVKSKFWIEADGQPVFGRGRKELLDAIDRCGSINRAAAEMNMSYRKAWGAIRAMEERLGIRLIERTTGGPEGGGAVLTDDARKFMAQYRAVESGMQQYVDERFKAVFRSGE
ncbi:MAG: winged helix-turn-helix domain-containing protein [Nitrospiraceae bacterium]|nr:winged helix-turn-helix domain-containing protein [Nitrospiraceae bacterium]